MAAGQGDHAAAVRFHEQSLAMHEQLGELKSVQFALHNLANATLHEGNLGRSRELYERSLAVSDPRGAAGVVTGFAGAVFAGATGVATGCGVAACGATTGGSDTGGTGAAVAQPAASSNSRTTAYLAIRAVRST
jgi:hypothetical protein